MTAYGLTAPILYHLTRHYLFWHSWLRYLAQNWGWVQQSRTEWFPSPRMVVRVMWHSSAWLTAPQKPSQQHCRAERGKAHLWLKAGSCPGGILAQARGHCPVPVASSTPMCWALHQQDPGAGTALAPNQGTCGCGEAREVPHCRAKHQHIKGLSCVLCLSSVLFGVVLDI